mmetsp:Transcript_7461/g.17077  ORF Transcript_7461/g.17077 Transcript_7461/m.17077 type:complete len:265 (-) Transcript_7461:52-846(-)
MTGKKALLQRNVGFKLGQGLRKVLPGRNIKIHESNSMECSCNVTILRLGQSKARLAQHHRCSGKEPGVSRSTQNPKFDSHSHDGFPNAYVVNSHDISHLRSLYCLQRLRKTLIVVGSMMKQCGNHSKAPGSGFLPYDFIGCNTKTIAEIQNCNMGNAHFSKVGDQCPGSIRIGRDRTSEEGCSKFIIQHFRRGSRTDLWEFIDCSESSKSSRYIIETCAQESKGERVLGSIVWISCIDILKLFHSMGRACSRISAFHCQFYITL